MLNKIKNGLTEARNGIIDAMNKLLSRKGTFKDHVIIQGTMLLLGVATFALIIAILNFIAWCLTVVALKTILFTLFMIVLFGGLFWIGGWLVFLVLVLILGRD